MISCNLNRVKRVLCLGAHSDDIEIGCGGTVLRMIEQSKGIEFYWLVLCANPERTMEASRSANAFLARARKKVDNLMRYFATQRDKRWFCEELFYGLMRLRSTEAASPTHYSEAFYCRKLLLATAN